MSPLLEHGFVEALTTRIGPMLRLTLTDNRRTYLSVERSRGTLKVRLARWFALADRETFEALVRFLTGRERSVPVAVRRFAESRPPCPETVKRSKRAAVPQGSHHHLGEIAREIRRRYFKGSSPVAATWGRAPSSRPRRGSRRTIQLGSYNRDLDLVTIHPALDAPWVPRHYLGYVLYHELLHRHFADVPGSSGGNAHPREFREAERRYEGYAEAIHWERNNISRLLRRRGIRGRTPVRGG